LKGENNLLLVKQDQKTHNCNILFSLLGQAQHFLNVDAADPILIHSKQKLYNSVFSLGTFL